MAPPSTASFTACRVSSLSVPSLTAVPVLPSPLKDITWSSREAAVSSQHLNHVVGPPPGPRWVRMATATPAQPCRGDAAGSAAVTACSRQQFDFVPVVDSLGLSYFKLTESESEVAQSCRTLRNPVDCSPPGSSLHGIFQARILEWVAISFSRGSSLPRSPRRNPACRGTFGGRRKAVRDRPTISSSVGPFSSGLQSFPGSGSFLVSQFFASGGRSIGVSASASVLPMNIQD